jgi:putative NADPH-quinone reductase
MKILVLFAHPIPDSFNAALHGAVVEALRAAGHEVDDLDLYAEGFQPVLSAEEWRNYQDLARNRATVDSYVRRVQWAQAVVFVFPTWCFGEPAILKGWFDRVLIPGVSFSIGEDGRVRPALTNIRKIVGISTYGRPWWHVRLIVGDLPRRHVTHYFRALCGAGTAASYFAIYDTNNATDARRTRFLDRVRRAMARF